MKTVQQVVNKSKYNGDAHNFLQYGGHGSLRWYLEEGWVLKHIHIQGEAESVFAVFEKQVETIELYKYRELEAENQHFKTKLEKANKVIRFYASCAIEDMWEPPFDGGSKSGSLGDAARAVLKEIEGES